MTTVTKASTRTVRRINRRPLKVVLQATKPGMRRLRYMGGGKFSEKGKPMLFGSREAAQSAARVLKDMYPAALRGWLLGFSS